MARGTGKPTTTIGSLCACASLRVWEEYGCFCVTPVDFGPLSGNATMGSEVHVGTERKSLERSCLTRPWSLRAALRYRKKNHQMGLFALWRNGETSALSKGVTRAKPSVSPKATFAMPTSSW